jgi:hypothetical protein
MPNYVQYSPSIPSGSIKKGTVALGITDSVTGPTSTTGWYAGINPASGSYVIYEVSSSGDPEIYCPQNTTELINLVKSKGATGANTGSAADVLAWIGTQPNLLAVNEFYPNIVTDGDVLILDAGFVGSYPTTASTWYDISGNNNSGSLVNGPTFNSNGYINFDGVDDFSNFSSVINFNDGSPFTAQCLINIPYFTGQNLNRVHWISGTGGNSMMIFSSTSFQMWNEAGGVNNLIINYNFPTNKIFQTTITRDSNNVVSLYINGTYINQGSRSGQFRWATIARLGSATTYCSRFSLYNMMVYGKSLSSTEVLQNYYQGPIVTDGLVFAVDASNLVSYESGSATTYSMTGSATGSLLNGTGYSSTGGGTWTFDGIDDSISTNPPAFSSSTNSLSFNFWVYPTGTSTSSQAILGRDTNSAGATPHILIRRTGNLNLTWNYSNGTSAATMGFSDVFLNNLNKWVNLQVTANYTTGAVNIYRNGIFYSQQTMSTPVFPNTSVPVYISSFVNAGFIPWTGNISTAQIYNKELTAAEIIQNFNAQKGRFGL